MEIDAEFQKTKLQMEEQIQLEKNQPRLIEDGN